MDKLWQTIIAFINAKSWEESQQIVEEHSELLRSEVDSMMQELLMEQEEEDAKEAVEVHRALLARCREVGIREAFASKSRTANGVQGLQADFAQVQQLMAQKARNPQASERLIQLYEQMLERLPPTPPTDAYSILRGAILNNLGTVYRDLPTGDKGANLAHAIAYYQEALRFRTADVVPDDYATTQHNLGIAYRNLPTGDKGTNLAHAIACYQEALRFWTAQTAPFQYAATQNNRNRSLPPLLKSKSPTFMKKVRL